MRFKKRDWRRPCLDHPIHIVPHPARLRVLWNGKVVADTIDALMLHEASYPGVRYIPRADVDMTLLTVSPLKTHCPYKGEANYFSIGSERRDGGECDLEL